MSIRHNAINICKILNIFMLIHEWCDVMYSVSTKRYYCWRTDLRNWLKILACYLSTIRKILFIKNVQSFARICNICMKHSQVCAASAQILCLLKTTTYLFSQFHSCILKYYKSWLFPSIQIFIDIQGYLWSHIKKRLFSKSIDDVEFTCSVIFNVVIPNLTE